MATQDQICFPDPNLLSCRIYFTLTTTALYYTTRHDTPLHCLHDTTLLHTTSHCTILHYCITLHGTTRHHTPLHHCNPFRTVNISLSTITFFFCQKPHSSTRRRWDLELEKKVSNSQKKQTKTLMQHWLFSCSLLQPSSGVVCRRPPARRTGRCTSCLAPFALRCTGCCWALTCQGAFGACVCE